MNLTNKTIISAVKDINYYAESVYPSDSYFWTLSNTDGITFVTVEVTNTVGTVVSLKLTERLTVVVTVTRMDGVSHSFTTKLSNVSTPSAISSLRRSQGTVIDDTFKEAVDWLFTILDNKSKIVSGNHAAKTTSTKRNAVLSGSDVSYNVKGYINSLFFYLHSLHSEPSLRVNTFDGALVLDEYPYQDNSRVAFSINGRTVMDCLWADFTKASLSKNIFTNESLHYKAKDIFDLSHHLYTNRKPIVEALVL